MTDLLNIIIVLLISISTEQLILPLLFVICNYIDSTVDRMIDSSTDVNVTKLSIDHCDSSIDIRIDGTVDSSTPYSMWLRGRGRTPR